MTSELLTPAQAARSLPQPVAPATIWRWCVRGITAANGKRIILAHYRNAGRLYVRKADLDAFLAQAGEIAGEHFAQRREPRQVKRAAQRAEAARKLNRRRGMKSKASA